MLSSITGLTTISDAVAIGTITDNDTSEVSIAATTQAGEPGFNGLFTVSLSNPASVATTVSYSVTGTATADIDYTALVGTIVIPAGSISVTINVDVIDDNIVETGGETVIVTLTSTDSAITVGAEDNATVIIADNDVSQVAVGIIASTQASEPGNDGLFTFTLSNVSSTDTEISFTIAGTAIEGVDYDTIGTSVIIPANTMSITIPVVVIDDSIFELTETVIINIIGTDTAVTISTNNTATVTIGDDDASEVSIVATTQASEPSTIGLFTLSVNNAVSIDTEVSYSISGTATNGGDYSTLTGTVTIPANTLSIAIPIEVIDDNFVEEGGETVIVTLLSTNSGVDIATQDAATITIGDDDASEVSIITTTDAGESSFNGLFTVTLNNFVSVDTQVYYTVSGTATEGTDYVALTGTVIIPANTTSAVIDITVIDDNLVEGDETVVVTLIGTDSSVTVSVTDEATMTITDNDASILSISATVQASEPDLDGKFTLSLTEPLSVDTEVTYTASGTASEDIDYTALTGIVIIPAGDTSAIIDVSVIDDAIVESSETVIVTLIGTDTTVTIGSSDEATVTISDDDVSEVSITATNQASEPSANGLFTVSLSNSLSVDTTVSYTVSGTATAGIDYTSLSGFVLIPAGNTSVSISVDVLDDTIVESGGESVIITLISTDTSVTIAENEASVIIADDDGITVSIDNVSVYEGDNSITDLEFTVTLSSSSNSAITVDYVTNSGTATTDDYNSIETTTLEFLPGELSKTISVQVIGDGLVELDEIFTVELSNLVPNGNAIVLANAIGIGTILNDDHSPIITDVVMTGIEDNNLLFATGDFITSFEDVDGDSLYSIQIQSLPENGILYLNGVEVSIGDIILASAINDLVFIAHSNWYGETSFEYNASDGVNNALENGQVIITINPVDDLPIANDDFVTTEQNISIVNGLTAVNDIPSEDGGNVWSLIGENGGAQHGTVSMNTDGVYTYTPDIYFFGTDSFVYSITDADGDTSNAVVTITVAVASDPSIELIKIANIGGEGNVGDIITYTFEITNNGNVSLNNIIINDPLISETPIAVVGMLEPNDNASVNAYYTITQNDIDTGSVSNTAIVSGVDVLGNEISDISDNGNTNDGNDNPTITLLEQKPLIAIVKTAEFNDDNLDGYAQAGETITYYFTVSNIGNVALSNITVSDPLPGVVVSGGPISLGAGEFDDDSFTATYVITQDDINLGSVTNQASVSGTSPRGVVVGDSSDDYDNYGDNPTVLEISGCEIEVFNAVSPNGDGVNDVFYIRGLECYPDNSVEIYNRWGGLVFERDHYNNADRAFKGISEGKLTINQNRELPDGAYYYIFKYTDGSGNAHQKAGYLYINRR
jgi:gliding motility-associated-like protein